MTFKNPYIKGALIGFAINIIGGFMLGMYLESRETEDHTHNHKK